MAKKTGPSAEQLETAFRHGNFKPLYFFFGEETFLMDELQGLLIENALAPHERDFNLDVVYGPEHEAPAVLALCNGFPMMAERRVIVVREFDRLRENRLFKSYAERPNPHAIVLLACASKPNLSAHPYRALRAHAEWSEFRPLYSNQVPGWIDGRARRMGYTLGPGAAQMLAEFVGADLRGAVGELEKLATYAGGRTALSADDVLAASGQTREFNVFELQKAVGEGRHADACVIAERLLQQASSTRGEALMIVSVLTAYFTKLWKLRAAGAARASDADLARRIGVSPYFVKEYVHAARRFDRAAIQTAFAALLAADYELKGGAQRDDWTVLALLLRRIVPRSAPARAA